MSACLQLNIYGWKDVKSLDFGTVPRCLHECFKLHRIHTILDRGKKSRLWIHKYGPFHIIITYYYLLDKCKHLINMSIVSWTLILIFVFFYFHLYPQVFYKYFITFVHEFYELIKNEEKGPTKEKPQSSSKTIDKISKIKC